MRVSTIRLDFDKEYETIWALGAQCGISDLEAIIEANYLCSDLALDTISTSVTIGCTMELAEKGIIESELRFGAFRVDLLGGSWLCSGLIWRT